MKSLRLGLAAALMLSFSFQLSAAPPEVVGSYEGTLKGKRFEATGQTSIKHNIALTVAADNSSTFTIDGTAQVTLQSLYSSTEASILFADPVLGPIFSLYIGQGAIKNGKISGSIRGLEIDTSNTITQTVEAKIKLKKNP